MSDKDEKKGLAVGAAIGAVVGVITGLLFAPKSGKDTRKDIKTATSTAVKKCELESKNVHQELSKIIEKGELYAKTASRSAIVSTKKLLEQAKHSRELLTTVATAFKKGKAEDKDLDKAIQEAKKARDALKKYLKS